MTQPPQTAPSEDELAERLRGAIRQGDILNDGRMPPERALAEHFGVTHQTIRRDLTELADSGKLERVHGGAVLPSGASNIGYAERRNLHEEANDEGNARKRGHDPGTRD